MRNKLKVVLVAVLTACMILSFDFTVAFANTHAHCDCGSKSCTGEGHDYSKEWQAWDSTSTLPTTSGYYYLTGNVKIDNWKIPTGADIHLCLNGNVISAESIYSNDSASDTNWKLTLTDCSTDSWHYFKYHKADKWVWNQDAETAGAIETSQINDNTAENQLIKVKGGCVVLNHYDNPADKCGNIKVCYCCTLNASNVNVIGGYGGGRCSGSGIQCLDNAVIRLDNCSILGNTHGCAIAALSSTKGSYLTNCDVSYNSGYEYGGNTYDGEGVFINGEMTINNCTFCYNQTWGLSAYNRVITVNGIEAQHNGGGGVYSQCGASIGGKIVVKNNTMNGEPCDFCIMSEMQVTSSGIASDSSIGVAFYDWMGVLPFTVMESNYGDFTSCFFSDEDAYMIKKGENNEVILDTRIVEQPAFDNDYTVGLNLDGLNNPEVSYQWQLIEYSTANLSALVSGTDYSINSGTATPASNTISSAEMQGNNCIGMMLKKNYTGIQFTCEKDLTCKYGEYTYGDLTKEGNTYTCFYNNAYKYIYLADEDGEAFTISNVKFLTPSYSDVLGETMKYLKDGTEGETYRCKVTINGKEIASNGVKVIPAATAVKLAGQTISNSGYVTGSAILKSGKMHFQFKDKNGANTDSIKKAKSVVVTLTNASLEAKEDEGIGALIDSNIPVTLVLEGDNTMKLGDIRTVWIDCAGEEDVKPILIVEGSGALKVSALGSLEAMGLKVTDGDIAINGVKIDLDVTQSALEANNIYFNNACDVNAVVSNNQAAIHAGKEVVYNLTKGGKVCAKSIGGAAVVADSYDTIVLKDKNKIITPKNGYVCEGELDEIPCQYIASEGSTDPAEIALVEYVDSSKSTDTKTNTNTGDSNNIALFSIFGILALCGAGFVYKRREN